jgi:heme oxygenase
MSSSPVTHSCPFAAALDADETSSVEGSSSPVPLRDVKRCPAFQDSNCPFKDAKSSQEVRETLAKVPPSHYAADGQFFRVIRELHNVKVDDETFLLQGGCPVQQHQQGRKSRVSSKSFHDAMEDFSFAAIMASLVTQEEDEDDEQDEIKGKESTETNDTSLASSTTTSSTLNTSHMKLTTTSLSQSLKTGTAASHQAAEDVHFVANFIKGKVDRTLYAQLVHMLYGVYDALEKCLDNHAHEHFPSCHFPKELCRTPSLMQDLDFWYGSNVPSEMTPATKDYANRIYEIAQTDPLLLLAHSYTRYLGDLSGGRILARVAKRAMHLGGDQEPVEGLAFYHFEHVESPKKFKD